ncbi:MAG: transposase [Spirochaetaceae bacterium]|jgi:REP element-mobilizing transposase RayT|nr:transposase [Spirochaetaceae bacterium]
MRMSRILVPDIWYKIFTAVNRHEPIFLDRDAVDLFNQTLCETGERFPCEVRHLVITADSVSFYIKPVDGLQLPEIMQWLKQTYAARYNVHDGRTGHIWGDRYASWIVEGSPKDAKEYVFAPVACKAGRRVRKRRAGRGGGVPGSGSSAADPVIGTKGRPQVGETARKDGSPPGLPRRTAPTHG